MYELLSPSLSGEYRRDNHRNKRNITMFTASSPGVPAAVARCAWKNSENISCWLSHYFLADHHIVICHSCTRVRESVLLPAQFLHPIVIPRCVSIVRSNQQKLLAPTTYDDNANTEISDKSWPSSSTTLTIENRPPRSPSCVRRLMKREIAGEMLPARTRQPLLHAPTWYCARKCRESDSHIRLERCAAGRNKYMHKEENDC